MERRRQDGRERELEVRILALPVPAGRRLLITRDGDVHVPAAVLVVVLEEQVEQAVGVASPDPERLVERQDGLVPARQAVIVPVAGVPVTRLMLVRMRPALRAVEAQPADRRHADKRLHHEQEGGDEFDRVRTHGVWVLSAERSIPLNRDRAA